MLGDLLGIFYGWLARTGIRDLIPMDYPTKHTKSRMDVVQTRTRSSS